MGSAVSLVGVDEKLLRDETGEGGLEALFSRFVQEMRIKHVQYVSFEPAWPNQFVSIGTAPQDFIELYLKQAQAGASADLEKARGDEISFMWNDMASGVEQPNAMDGLRERFGSNGMSIWLAPKPCMTAISLTSDEPEEEWRSRSSEILWHGLHFGHKIHEMVRKMHKASEQKVWLSENQVACLASIASGMDARATAVMCRLKEKSVMKHLNAAQKKLGAHNHTHAVAKAILLGLIPG